jgi:hypothetical protein
MTEDDRLQRLLRSAFPRTTDQGPSCDLWPLIVNQIHAPVRRSWFDISLAAVIAILLIMFPEWLQLLAYHL